MYELRIENVFPATHALRLYDGSLETPHAHDWRVLVEVEAQALDAIEVVMDFHALEAHLRDVLTPLHNADLNTHAAFQGMNPSAERVAEHIYKALRPKIEAPAHLTRVTVTEAPGCRASYRA